MQELGISTIQHIHKEQNRAADKLSKEGTNQILSSELEIMEIPPMYAMKEVEAGMLETTYAKKINYCNSDLNGYHLPQLSYEDRTSSLLHFITFWMNEWNPDLPKKRKKECTLVDIRFVWS